MKLLLNKGLALANLRVIKTNNVNNINEKNVFEIHERLIDMNILFAKIGIVLYSGIFCVTIFWL